MAQLVQNKRRLFGGLLILTATAGITAVVAFSPRPPAPLPAENMSVNVAGIDIPPNTLMIPSLELRAPIVESAGTTEGDFQRALQKGIVHYPGTAEAGQLGNAYYFGHSSDFAWTAGEYKTVFARLPEIKNGSTIFVSDAAGKVYAYIVREQFVVDPDETSVLEQTRVPTLTLQTSYPIGTAKQRYIVRAEIIPSP